MSVHPDRDGWRVKWRENGKPRSRSFKRKGDAELLDAEIKRRKALGQELSSALFDAPDTATLDEFVRSGFRTHAAVNLSPPTRTHYAWALENHLQELADEPLGALTVPRLMAHQEHLLAHGRSVNTTRIAMTRLSGILQVAVEHGLLIANPVRSLRKVRAEADEEVRPLSPRQLEGLIASLAGRARAIALLGGHLGLRPVEIRLAPWSAFDGDTFTVGRARTKSTAARTRVIAVPTITARELRAWRLESGGRDDDPIIGPISAHALSKWGARTLRKAITKVAPEIEDATLYTLRHSHASALHYCGHTVPSAAKRMGHSATVHLRTYAHVIDALEGQPRHADLGALIEASRRADVPPEFRTRKDGSPS